MADEAFVVQNDDTSVEGASDALTAAEVELAAFAGDITARRLLGAGYHDALAARVSAVDEARAFLRRAAGTQVAGAAEIERYDDLPVGDRKRILGSSIDAIFVSRAHARVAIEERVRILWRGEGPDDLPRRGRNNGPVRPYAP